MSEHLSAITTLGDISARQLANITKTAPQLSTISPRWLTHLLQWSPVESGIYRLNKVKNPEEVHVTCSKEGSGELPQTDLALEKWIP